MGRRELGRGAGRQAVARQGTPEAEGTGRHCKAVGREGLRHRGEVTGVEEVIRVETEIG